jgi:hypothetical protein
MTLLLRALRVDSMDRWLKLGQAGPTASEGAEVAGPPIWVIREFLPTDRDGEGLSVFEVNDKSEALTVAAAFAFESEKFEKRRYVFATVEKDKLKESGLDVVCTSGNFCHKLAESRHREIQIPNVRAAETIARLFMQGEIIQFEGRKLAIEARKFAQSDNLSYEPLARRPYSANWAWKAVLSFLGQKIVAVHGVPTKGS